MANPESKLKISELDFTAIKTNLREFLKDQSEFSDYNFEGSGMSVLLDVLAYNTHYMSYYLNMVANEMFLDTALTRPSVVSHAKLLGYTPRSRVASRAVINVAFDIISGDANSTMTISRFTRFISTEKDGTNYVFVTPEQTVLTKNNAGGFFAENLVIKEGQPQSYTFVYDSQTNTKQLFELPDIGIDTSTIKVQVQTSSQDTTKSVFRLATDSTEVTATSKVYYMDETRDGKYQIYFGENIIGKALDNGNIVIVTYIVTSGIEGNGLRSFQMMDTVPGYVPNVSIVSESSGGRLEETINSIKNVAPKSFVAQNRAVTKNDYVSLINRDYPYFSAVTVWGGEENSPPVYGKVFFSAKPAANYQLTKAEIDYVANKVIRPFSVMTVQPEYVAPDYNYINLEVNVTYDPTKTNMSEGQIKSAVRLAILSYAASNLNTFNNTLKISKLMREIDNVDPCIENNEVMVSLEKRFKPKLNESKNYILDFGIPLRKGNIIKRIFTTPSFKYYDGTGNLRDAYIEEVPQSFTGITEVAVLNSGSGYTETPTLTVYGDGRGAVLEPVIVNGKFRSVKVLNQGVDYSSATIEVTGGNGTGAVLEPLLQAKSGKLRIYYYDDNKVKVSINDNIGTVYYNEGYIQLEGFNPNLVRDAYGTLVIKAYPENTVFSASKNKILAIDSTDPESIKINLSALT